MSGTDAPEVDDAVELFVHGAKTLHVGYYLDMREVERKGLKIIGSAARSIDAKSATGRDPLLHLLQHEQEGVRTVAAAALWQSHPDKAIPVLKHIDRVGITEASMLAMKILMYRGRYNPCPSDPRYESLHEDENGVFRWDDPKFREQVYWGKVPSTFARRSDRKPHSPDTSSPLPPRARR